MDENSQAPIIIKRVKKVKKAGHHGGSWKIAYADFVTAMMAFFLIMWLLSLLNKSQLQSVAEYFKNPKKNGLIDKGSRVNKDKTEDYFLEKGKEKSTWKDVNKDQNKEKKKEDEKIKVEQKVVNPNAKLNQVSTNPMQQLQEMKKNLEQQLATNPDLQQYKNQLNFVVTADGLKIVLKDLENKPMFSTGKTDFEKYATNLLTWLGQELNKYPNQIVIIGHTDNVKYESNKYTNWELSADRANATRRALVEHGLDSSKVLRVIGESDRVLLDPTNGANPSNRRIDIIVLTNQAVGKMVK